MNEINALKAKLSPSFPKNGELNIKQFLDIENILYLAQQISPQLQASQAYLLLRGYHLIAHTQNNEQLYLMQQARIKWLSYSSRIQWEQFIEKYFSKEQDTIIIFLVNLDKKELERRINSREKISEFDLEAYKYGVLYKDTYEFMIKKYDAKGRLLMVNCTGLNIEQQYKKVKDLILNLNSKEELK